MNNDRLKFRVWDVKNKTYDHKFPFNDIGLFYIAQNGNLFSDFGNAVAPEIHDDRFIIEQSTGLRDKNGNLMYAGDKGIRNDCFVKNQEFVILWDEDNARFIAKTKQGILFFIPDGTCAEIIGNIHTQKDGE